MQTSVSMSFVWWRGSLTGDYMSSLTRGSWLSVPRSPMVWLFQTDTTMVTRYAFHVKLDLRKTLTMGTSDV